MWKYVQFIVGLFAVFVLGCGRGEKSENRLASDTMKTEGAAAHGVGQTSQPEVLNSVYKNATDNSISKSTSYYDNIDLASFMKGINGTFVFFDIEQKKRLVYNDERAKASFSPCSTFKIPNTLIALETGTVEGPDTTIKWDSKAYPRQEWWDTALRPAGYDWARDHTLQTAFKNSCVWYFKESAKRTGSEKMQAYLNTFNYGNRDISSGIDSFWLEGSLKISAVEQAEFLERLAQNRLGLSDKTMSDGFTVFERERKDETVLYAKTGGGSTVGWFVGIVDRKGKKYVFAFNMEGSLAETGLKRVEIPMRILKELGVWH